MNKQLFAGSGTLLRFLFRRDRVRLPIWILGLSIFVVALAPVFENVIIVDGQNAIMAEMMKNPAMIAIVGPVYGADNFHVGAAFSNMMLLFSVMFAGIMNIMLITRHTRHDEELGRLEMIRSLPVGRLANLASAMLAALIANALLAVLTGLGMYILRVEGMDFNGCMLFGACMGIIGLFFAAVTALFCQATANNRTASGLAYMLLMLLYMLRAVGDINSEPLSLISPLGLILRTKIFVDSQWWPAGVVLAITAVLSILVFRLAMARDLGRGLVAERPGRRHASALLSSPLGLALKLLKTQLIVWMVTVFILSASYGSVFGDLDSFIGGNDMLKAIFAANPNFSLAEQFITMLVAIMAMISTIPVISFVNRVAAEEKRGHTEHLLARSVSRGQQLAAYVGIAFLASVVLQLLSAVGFWLVGSMVLETLPSLGIIIMSTLLYLPAIWVMIGFAMMLVALLPDRVSIAYIWLGYSFFSVYLAVIANLPDWLGKLTPFGYIPQYPIEQMKLGAPLVLTAIALLMAVASFVVYNRRDLQT